MPTRTEMEMRQGEYIAKMNGEREFYQKFGCTEAVQERRVLLDRWSEANKIFLSYTEPRSGNQRRDRVIALVDDRSVQWSETHSDTWPSEQLVANIGLAIGALSSFNGVKGMTSEQQKAADERARRDEYRRHLVPPEFWEQK